MFGDIRASIIQIDRVALLTVSGDVDIATGDDFAQVLEQAISLPVEAVEVDLAEVTHFGSEGIRRLLQARSAAANRGVGLSLVAVSRQARQVLEITRMTGVIGLPER